MEFRTLVLGAWSHESPREKRKRDLARQYHDKVELYDLGVCTGGTGPCGGAMPADGHERGLISRNALAARKAILACARTCGISDTEMSAAIQDYAQRSSQ